MELEGSCVWEARTVLVCTEAMLKEAAAAGGLGARAVEALFSPWQRAVGRGIAGAGKGLYRYVAKPFVRGAGRAAGGLLRGAQGLADFAVRHPVKSIAGLGIVSISGSKALDNFARFQNNINPYRPYVP